MHDEIRRFHLEGEIGDTNLVVQKERLVESEVKRMRDKGYVPLLDIEPQLTLNYRPADEVYDFALSVYGVMVGKERAWQVAGIMSGKEILRSTQNLK